MSEVLDTQMTTQASKKRLGRGLDSLFGGEMNIQEAPLTTHAPPPVEVVTQSVVSDTQRMMAIEKLAPNKDQPRSHFEKEKLEELAASIRVHGIVQPIIVRKLPDSTFQIVAGERRWRAAQLAGLKDVPVIIQDLDNQKTLEIALIENIQRSDLNPLEEAKAYQRLLTTYQLTQQQLADRVGKDRATVANFLRLLNLDNQVQELIEYGHISLGHAKILAGNLNTQDQMWIAKEIVDKNLSVRDTEKLVNKVKRQAEQGEIENKANPDFELRQKMVTALSEELQKKLGTKVLIDYTEEGKGRIVIQFYSDEQLNSVIDQLREV